jgi:hypothetical protein
MHERAPPGSGRQLRLASQAQGLLAIDLAQKVSGLESTQNLEDAMSHQDQPFPHRRSAMMKALAAVVLALWLAVVLLLGVSGRFVRPPGTVPFPIAIGVLAPLIVFLAGYWWSARFGGFVSSADLPLVTAVQAWRFVGFGFLALYAYGVLPGVFAWPAGLGDMFIALTAPWVALALVRRPSFGASRLFVTWNLLGILDLVVAVGGAAINQSLATGAAGEVTVAPMAQMPLVLIPAYLVPLFVMLHLTSLFQARREARSKRGERSAVP